MGIVPSVIGCHSNEEFQTNPSPHLQSSSESTSLYSQPSLPTVPSLSSQTHLPPTTHQCISTLKGHSSHVSFLALSGKSLYSGSFDNEIRLWGTHPSQPTSPNAANPTYVVAAGGGAVKSLAILHNRLISAHQDYKIRVWQIDYTDNPNRNHRNYNYKLLATLPTLKDRLLRFLPPKNHVQVRRHKKTTWVHHVDAVSALAVSADGGTLYSVSWDRTLKIWRTTDFMCLESVAGAHDDAINALAISHDGFIYTGSADTRIKVWKKLSGEKRHSLQATLEKHRSAVNALALNSDGSVLYSGACDRSIVVWERDDRNGSGSSGGAHMVVVGALRGHVKAILCLALVSDMVCSGSADRTIRIWRRGLGRGYSCLAVLEGHGGPVKCLVGAVDRYGAGPCGTSLHLYSGSFDCDIKVWQLSIPDFEGQVLQ